MSGLFSKPRVKWLPSFNVWVMEEYGYLISSPCLVTVIKRWYDNKYGENNHAYH